MINLINLSIILKHGMVSLPKVIMKKLIYNVLTIIAWMPGAAALRDGDGGAAQQDAGVPITSAGWGDDKLQVEISSRNMGKSILAVLATLVPKKWWIWWVVQ